MTGKSDRLEQAKKQGLEVIEKPFEVNKAIALLLDLKNQKCNSKPSSYENVKF